ncbi:NAD(P)-binding protein [Clavulina sp. PMI_390]|nr:NAD(P)-binding protein [Clavulina sp. PMI_390]
MSQKIIAVIGGTGAQGSFIVRGLLAPSADGSPSPWKVRVLTRNPTHHRAKELEDLGVEFVQGSFMDYDAVEKLFEGAYGAYVNTDTFTVGAAAETTAAFNIWELANWHKIRHFVWSNQDYAVQIGAYNPMYRSQNHVAKGRFGAFLSAQPNPLEGEGTLWTKFTVNSYMEMLSFFFAPEIMPDGTRVFFGPMNEDSTLPLISQEDMAWWSRYTFDHPDLTTGRELKLTSAMPTLREIAETFTKVSGLPATYRLLTMDQYFSLYNGKEIPAATAVPISEGGMSWETHFRGWWALWRDNLVERDLEWIKSVHPTMTTLEQWMRDTKYEGYMTQIRLLKNSEDHIGNLRRKSLAEGTEDVDLGY